MTSLWEVLSLGLLLGVRHAFDADHLVAVSTIVAEYRNPLKAIWIGVSWGLGHTTTLFVAGSLLLLTGLSIPDNMAAAFESLVGVMLIVLGVQTFLSLRRSKVHVHTHQHPEAHLHFHSHEHSDDHAHHAPGGEASPGRLIVAGIKPGEHLDERNKRLATPLFRMKSYIVGTVHGLAGSAALMLLVLASLDSVLDGVAYILLFGLGTLVSMGIISAFISVPFSASSRLPRLNRIVQAAAGAFSIGFGVMFMYQAVFVQSAGG